MTGSRCILGYNDRESFHTGVTQSYDTGHNTAQLLWLLNRRSKVLIMGRGFHARYSIIIKCSVAGDTRLSGQLLSYGHLPLYSIYGQFHRPDCIKTINSHGGQRQAFCVVVCIVLLLGRAPHLREV